MSEPSSPDEGSESRRTLAGSSRRKQSAGGASIRRDLENFATALSRIDERLRRVSASDRADFHDGSASYDAATLAIIRLHALREATEYGGVFDVLTAEESNGLSRMRNIASHTGYQAMDDALLWDAATRLLPELLPRLRESAEQCLAPPR